MNEIFNFYLKKQEPNKSCFLALREIILGLNEHMSETMKYGMPCFCFKNKAFCYLWIDKKTQAPYILLVEGKHLTHPALEAGNRKRMKILRIDPVKDLPIDIIQEVYDQAIKFYE